MPPAATLPVISTSSPHWTATERDRLRDMLALGHTHEAIARVIGRTPAAVRSMVRRQFFISLARKAASVTRWSAAEEEIIRGAGPDAHACDLLLMLPGRTLSAIKAKQASMGQLASRPSSARPDGLERCLAADNYAREELQALHQAQLQAAAPGCLELACRIRLEGPQPALALSEDLNLAQGCPAWFVVQAQKIWLSGDGESVVCWHLEKQS